MIKDCYTNNNNFDNNNNNKQTCVSRCVDPIADIQQYFRSHLHRVCCCRNNVVGNCDMVGIVCGRVGKYFASCLVKNSDRPKKEVHVFICIKLNNKAGVRDVCDGDALGRWRFRN